VTRQRRQHQKEERPDHHVLSVAGTDPKTARARGREPNRDRKPGNSRFSPQEQVPCRPRRLTEIGRTRRKTAAVKIHHGARLVAQLPVAAAAGCPSAAGSVA
jgi:hypothetical protein